MKNLRLLVGQFTRLQTPGFTQLLLGVLALGGLLSCSPNGQPGTSTRQTKLRLFVGEIKEITWPTPADSSIQVLATSENPEVVDVSRRETVNDSTGQAAERPARMGFLLKGVTAGTARVVFSEKPTGLDAQERLRRTYLVEVVNK